MPSPRNDGTARQLPHTQWHCLSSERMATRRQRVLQSASKRSESTLSHTRIKACAFHMEWRPTCTFAEHYRSRRSRDETLPVEMCTSLQRSLTTLPHAT